MKRRGRELASLTQINALARRFPPNAAAAKNRGAKSGCVMPEDDEAARIEAARLEAALKETPRGAFALAGTSVALLILCWLSIYFFVFLPRGQVG